MYVRPADSEQGLLQRVAAGLQPPRTWRCGQDCGCFCATHVCSATPKCNVCSASYVSEPTPQLTARRWFLRDGSDGGERPAAATDVAVAAPQRDIESGHSQINTRHAPVETQVLVQQSAPQQSGEHSGALSACCVSTAPAICTSTKCVGWCCLL